MEIFPIRVFNRGLFIFYFWGVLTQTVQVGSSQERRAALASAAAEDVLVGPRAFCL